MKAEKREQAIQMRINEQMGYSTIAKKLGVSKGTLSRWLEHLPLTEERIRELRQETWSRGEAKRERFRATMRQKREQFEKEIYAKQVSAFRKVSRHSLFIAGLMLYVAEGDKKSRYEIAFTNTDPTLIRYFCSWLYMFLDVKKETLKIQLHLYENMDIAGEENFWKQALHFSQAQLCKSQVKQLRPKSFSYRDSIRHGTCKLYIGDGAKKARLMLSIRAFFDTYERHMQV